MKKGGYSQIEMILAFLIFIAVVVFVLYFIGLGKNVNNTSETLDSLKDKIMRNITTDIISASLKLNISAGAKNAQIDLNVPSGYNPSIRNLSGANLSAGICGNVVCLKSETGKEAVKIILSTDLPAGTTFSSWIVANYSLGPLLAENVLSEKKAKILKDVYNSQYDSLKEYFAITPDFSFSVRNDSSIVINSSKAAPSKIQVYKSVERKEMLREDGRIEFVSVEVNVW